VLDDQLAEVERRSKRKLSDSRGMDRAGKDRSSDSIGFWQQLEQIGLAASCEDHCSHSAVSAFATSLAQAQQPVWLADFGGDFYIPLRAVLGSTIRLQ
jgi:hypothetical protein